MCGAADADNAENTKNANGTDKPEIKIGKLPFGYILTYKLMEHNYQSLKYIKI